MRAGVELVARVAPCPLNDLLGQVLERKGDQAGACEAYRYVLGRWGNARPRSVIAEEARARSKALGCPR